MKVTLTLLVTDKGVEVLQSIDRDELRRELAAHARDAVLFRDATRFEVRAYTIEVPLLASAESAAVDAEAHEIVVDDDIQRVFDEFRARHGAEELERLRDRLFDILSPGTWKITHEGSSRRIQRVGG